MDSELRDRRRATWRYLQINGVSEQEAASRVADEYDVDESTVSEDIRDMEVWLPEISRSEHEAQISLIYELEETRQRLYEMAEEAEEANETATELRIQRTIINSIKLGSQLNEEIDRSPRSEIERTADKFTR